MKIFLFGYGQMGKEVEKLILQRGHELAGIYDPYHAFSFDKQAFAGADMVIDYTTPGSAVYNITMCFENNKPIVVGTTGWYHEFDQVVENCKIHNGTLFYATNFSIGVNLMFKLNELLSRLLHHQENYKLSIHETHHIHKKDTPSGTASTLADSLIRNIGRYEKYTLYKNGEEAAPNDNSFSLFYSREGEVIGKHRVEALSDIDRLTIEHEAFNRTGFATGTLVASEWLLGKKGIFTMQDLFDNI